MRPSSVMCSSTPDTLPFGKTPELVPGTPAREPAVGSDRAPVSCAQQRLWFLDQVEPGTPVYNVPFALRLLGDLDADSLQQALNDIVLRHEALRTNFVLDTGVPV